MVELLLETLCTTFAFKTPLVQMHTLNMVFQISFILERSIALFTGERSLRRMHILVHLQVSSSAERLGTTVAFKGPSVRVHRLSVRYEGTF